jgi:hypothetical protein
MFRLTAATLLMLGLAALPVRAAEEDADGDSGSVAFVSMPEHAVAVSRFASLSVPVSPRLANPISRRTSLSRPGALPMLYVSLVGLQAYDLYSTRSAISHGGHESNPMMQGVADSTTGMAVAKAVSTGGMIYLAERLWKTNHRKGAVIALLVTNGLMGAVAMNNANVLSQQRR